MKLLLLCCFNSALLELRCCCLRPPMVYEQAALSASYVRLLKKFVFGRMLESLSRQTKLGIIELQRESSVTVASHTGLDPHLEATLRAWNNL